MLTELEKQTKRAKYITGVRQMMTYLEENPNVPVPSTDTFNAPVWTASDMAAAARIMGDVKKVASESYMSLVKEFGPVKLDVYVYRGEVCERVVVGTETIPSHYEPEHVREIVEWKCRPILGADLEDSNDE